jgi:hypothetical protein
MDNWHIIQAASFELRAGYEEWNQNFFGVI